MPQSGHGHTAPPPPPRPGEASGIRYQSNPPGRRDPGWPRPSQGAQEPRRAGRFPGPSGQEEAPTPPPARAEQSRGQALPPPALIGARPAGQGPCPAELARGGPMDLRLRNAAFWASLPRRRGPVSGPTGERSPEGRAPGVPAGPVRSARSPWGRGGSPSPLGGPDPAPRPVVDELLCRPLRRGRDPAAPVEVGGSQPGLSHRRTPGPRRLPSGGSALVARPRSPGAAGGGDDLPGGNPPAVGPQTKGPGPLAGPEAEEGGGRLASPAAPLQPPHQPGPEPRRTRQPGRAADLPVRAAPLPVLPHGSGGLEEHRPPQPVLQQQLPEDRRVCVPGREPQVPPVAADPRGAPQAPGRAAGPVGGPELVKSLFGL
ncbi:forkhead box protein R1 isoform X2 [Sphaerodactylus townsendi]|uniref:forkhead box protein R1 isoform X2 n=1 Tax=Sphaerodactylus townsendi TaxID=933632 RepID=UPI0020261A89|nr:forkhead box protein R1 isoform X2 [Sphaerodactylus townsendi]